jgi:hypothetical protein
MVRFFPWSNGLMPCVRLRTELYDPRMADLFPLKSDVQGNCNLRRPDGGKQFHHPLSEKPGIGVEINEEGMRKYATPGMPFFE